MGSVRKASAWLGLVDDNDDERYYDDDYAEGPHAGDSEGNSPWVTDPRVRVADATAQDQGTRIATVTPDSFRDARGIGELFRDGVPVIVNLTSMEPADAKRVVDFAAKPHLRPARIDRAGRHPRLPAHPRRLQGAQRRGPRPPQRRFLQPELTGARPLTERRPAR